MRPCAGDLVAAKAAGVQALGDISSNANPSFTLVPHIVERGDRGA